MYLPQMFVVFFVRCFFFLGRWGKEYFIESFSKITFEAHVLISFSKVISSKNYPPQSNYRQENSVAVFFYCCFVVFSTFCCFPAFLFVVFSTFAKRSNRRGPNGSLLLRSLLRTSHSCSNMPKLRRGIWCGWVFFGRKGVDDLSRDQRS